ncbi:MAG: DUF4139 domain-containing protein [Chitinophagales bacterium]|jgi:uncharacterized protein (TIGR02231 family)|nr:DUF4139 domain-containing protein [Chitinophagales bacterium]
MKYFLVIISFCFIYSSSAQIHSDSSEVKPYEVMLYLRGAKVKAKTTVFLKQGRNSIIIKNLPQSIDENSIKIGLSEGANLFSFTPRNEAPMLVNAEPIDQKYTQVYIDSVNETYRRRIQKLDDQKNLVETKMRKIIEIIESNKNLVQTNSSKETPQTNFSQNLTTLINLYEQKVDAFQKELNQIEESRYNLTINQKNFQQSLSPKVKPLPISQKPDLLTKELVLDIQSNLPKNTTLDLTYMVSQASWIPLYDFKLDKISDPMQITYKAKVYQYTGQDWNQVKLTISAFMPKSSTQRPVLSSLYVDFQKYQVTKNIQLEYGSPAAPAPKRSEYFKEIKTESNAVNSFGASDKPTENLKFDVPTAQISQEILNVEYQLTSLQSILSSELPSNVVMHSTTAKTENKYYHVPKLSKNVYLMAWLKNWNQFNFLDGEASIYLNDNFVGKTWISSNFVGDKYPVSLGEDERIQAKRLTVKDIDDKMEKKNFVTHQFLWENVVRNGTAAEIAIDIYDQIPVSENKDVTIEDILYDGGKYNAENGFVHWDVTIPRMSSLTKRLGYKMKYPLDGQLQYENR